MTGRNYIVDIRRHRGSVPSYVIELVGRFCSGFPGAVVEWLVRPDQSHLLPPDRVIGQADPLDCSWTNRICERLVQLSATQNGGTGTPLWVLSYDNSLLIQARKLSTEKQPVTAVHLSELYKMNLVSRERSWRRTQTLEQPGNADAYNSARSESGLGYVSATLTVEEGELIAKQVLRGGHNTSPDNPLPQKELRPRMSRLDRRAVRQAGNVASENLIADLVDRGLQEGWLRRFRGVNGRTGTEMLYLIEESSATPKETLAQPRLCESVGAPAETEAVASVGPAHAATSAETVGITHPATPAMGAAELPRRLPKHKNRATEFEAVLSKSRIGAIPETRELPFNAIETIVSELNGTPVLVTELFSRAAKRAQQTAQETCYNSEQNWPTAERCIRRLMLWASVLIGDDGTPVADKIGSNSRRFVSLVPDFRRICEAYLVEHIIQKMGTINYDDDPYYLGLTLYRRGKERAVPPEDLKDRADAILLYLQENGRIEMDDERAVRIKAARKLHAIAS